MRKPKQSTGEAAAGCMTARPLPPAFRAANTLKAAALIDVHTRWNTKPIFRRLSLTLLTLGLSHAALGAVAYDNGPPNQVSGTQMSEFQVAENFTLGAAANINNIRFWSVQSALADYTGSVYWAIYSNSTGQPGGLLEGGVTASIAGSLTGSSTGFGYAEYVFDIPVTFTLGVGDYWLGLHNGALVNTATSEMLWSTTDVPVGSSGLYLDGVNWINSGNEHAFRFDAGLIPEPSTLALLAIGLVAVGLRSRKSL